MATLNLIMMWIGYFVVGRWFALGVVALCHLLSAKNESPH